MHFQNFDLFTVESLVDNMLDKVLEHPRFLDIAMRKIGTRMQQEHVSDLLSCALNIAIRLQAAMMKAVEVNAPKDPEGSNKDDIDSLARTHGYPMALSSVVEDKFDNTATVFMTEHFKTAIPVR